MTNLTDKVCLVAGASSGMGRQTALRLAKDGAMVICAARRLCACEELLEQIVEQGGQGCALQFDGTDPQSVDAMAAKILQQFGRLDGAFNNLGDTLGSSAVEETPDERWHATLDVNLNAVFYLLRAETPLLRAAGGGAIVNNSSTGGLQGVANMADYAAAKWGLIGLSRSLALELAAENIRVNVIAPGIIQTEKFEEFKVNSPALFESLLAGIPAGRFGEMADIAGLVTWLLSDDSKYLTGATLPIDGGRTA